MPTCSGPVLGTLLFTDIVGSTSQAIQAGNRQWRRVLDAHDARVIREVAVEGGRVVKNTGDGALSLFDTPSRAVRCALALLRMVADLGIRMRAGLHSGEVEARGTDVSGVAVHIAARVLGAASPEEVWVSKTVTDLVLGSNLAFDDRGPHELRGIPGPWQLFAARS
jgi:class 3 adenylate cyclase